MPEPRHYYFRPTWACRACGEPWPCAAKRADFLAKFSGPDDRIRLRGIMGALQLDAERDMPEEPRGDLYRRFAEWTFEPRTERVRRPNVQRNPFYKN